MHKNADNFRAADRAAFLRLQKTKKVQTIDRTNGQTIFRVKSDNGVFDFLDMYKAMEHIRNGCPTSQKPVEKTGWKTVERRVINGIKIMLERSPTGKRGRFYYNGAVMHKGHYSFVEEQYITFLSVMQAGMDDEDI